MIDKTLDNPTQTDEKSSASDNWKETIEKRLQRDTNEIVTLTKLLESAESDRDYYKQRFESISAEHKAEVERYEKLVASWRQQANSEKEKARLRGKERDDALAALTQAEDSATVSAEDPESATTQPRQQPHSGATQEERPSEITEEDRAQLESAGISDNNRHLQILALVGEIIGVFMSEETWSRAEGNVVEKFDTNGIVDHDWYFSTYPDVANAQMYPTLHYIRYGAFEGRYPRALGEEDIAQNK